MKCWFCDKDSKGTCAACGRGLCAHHAHFHDELTLAKSDTSTGYAASITFTMRSNVRIVVWNGSTIARPLTEFKKRTKIRAPFVILHCALCGSYAVFCFYASFYAKRILLLAEEGKRPWIAGESLWPVVPAFPPASVFLLLVDRNVP